MFYLSYLLHELLMCTDTRNVISVSNRHLHWNISLKIQQSHNFHLNSVLDELLLTLMKALL